MYRGSSESIKRSISHVGMLNFFGVGLVLIALGLAVSGCGGGGAPATLTGTVTFDGQPIEKGSIRLDPTGQPAGQPASTQITNGKYEFPSSANLRAGEYRVTIMGFRVVGSSKDPETGQEVETTEQYIPERYNTRTELSVTLKAGANTQDFPLVR